MRTRTRVRKAEDVEETKTNRLTGIVVNEVSIVDRAANQRKFLVVKDAPGVPPAPAPAPGTPAAPPPPAPGWTLSPELKAKLAVLLKSAGEKIAALTKRLEVSTESPGAAPPADLAAALSEVAGLFAAQKSEETPVEPAKDAATKAGRKISGARLAQLMSAKATIDSLIAEVSDAKGDDGDGDGDGGDSTTTATDTTKTNTKKTEGEEPPAPAPNPELTEIRTAIGALGSSLDKIAHIFEGQNARIEALSKSRGESRQADLERPRTVAKPVVWDLDMNNPIAVDPPAQRSF